MLINSIGNFKTLAKMFKRIISYGEFFMVAKVYKVANIKDANSL